MSCEADKLGTDLIASLLKDIPYETPNVSLSTKDFSVPDESVLTGAVEKLVNEDLTTRTVDGAGVFDALMAGFAAHLIQEYNKNRITGSEYTKAYTALSEAAMAQGSAFLVSRDRQYWDNLLSQQQAQLAQTQVATAKVKLETAKVEHSVTQLQALNLKAQYAATKMEIALKSSQFCISEYTLNEMMPRQLVMLDEQILGQITANNLSSFNLEQLMPIQKNLLSEQYQAALAQTSNTKSDGSPVVGNLGMQKALHAEQIVAYRNESQVKVAKLYTDAFITQFTINDEINVPNEFKELSVNSTIEALKANVGLPPSPTNGGTNGDGGGTPVVETNNTLVSGMTDAGMVYGTGTAGTTVEIEAADGSNTIVVVVASDGTYSVQYPVPHNYAAVPQMTYTITTRASSGGSAVGPVITFTPTQGYTYVAPSPAPAPAPEPDPSWSNVIVDYVTNGDSTVTVTVTNAVVGDVSEPGRVNTSNYPSMSAAIAWFTPLVWYSSGLPTITFN